MNNPLNFKFKHINIENYKISKKKKFNINNNDNNLIYSSMLYQSFGREIVKFLIVIK